MTTVFEPGTKQRAKSGAAAKAYLKRQRRSELMGLVAAETEPAESTHRPEGSLASRIPFILVLFAILAAGVAGVLVLNTMTDESGLRTEKSSAKSADLRLQIEQLQAEIATMDNTLAIAKAAEALGLVPAGDAAMLSVDKNGKVTVIGTPTPVVAPGAVPAAGEAGAAANTGAVPGTPVEGAPVDGAAVDGAQPVQTTQAAG